MKRIHRAGIAAVLVVLGLGSFERSARAEADTFANGSGRTKAFTAAAAGTVVNAYAPVTQAVLANAKTVSVGATVGTGAFAAGDLVMIWQATDGFGTSPASGDQTAVNLTATSKTGRYELARIASVGGATVEMSSRSSMRTTQTRRSSCASPSTPP